MKVKMYCSECDALIGEDEIAMADVFQREHLCEDFCEHSSRPDGTEHLRDQFGASDVENLAMAMWYAFHGRCPCPCHPDNAEEGDPWPAYEKADDEDLVVHAFRDAALEITDIFSDGYIGSMYYTGGRES